MDNLKLTNKEYRYRLQSTRESSSVYGVCEVCGKPVSEVFSQVEERHYIIKNEDKIYREGWTTDNCHNIYGHEKCLKSKQKQ